VAKHGNRSRTGRGSAAPSRPAASTRPGSASASPFTTIPPPSTPCPCVRPWGSPRSSTCWAR
jgi:hypothetical protein